MLARRGFTLLEVLVVVAILGIVVAAIGACMAAGMRVWETARRYEKGEPQLAMACAMMERDVVNAFQFYAVRFSGTVEGVSMPVLLASPGEDGEPSIEVKRAGTVRYFWLKDREALCRKSWVYPGTEPPDSSAEVVAGSLVHVNLQYAGPGDAPGVWRDAWTDPSNMPFRVRFGAQLSPEVGGYSVERTVVRPVTNGVAG